MGKYTNHLNHLLIAKESGYQRQLMQTYFTAPEWRNVEMAGEISEFLKSGHPFYRFPYFKQIATFWKVFAKSYLASKRHHSHMSLLTSEYMIMNMFIGLWTTLGFLALGIVSLFLYPWMKTKNDSPFQKKISKRVKDYASFIHKVPFYNYSYINKIKPVLKDYINSKNKTLADFATLLTSIAELAVRGVLSWPVAWWYNQPQNQQADRIHLLVKSSKSENEISKLDHKIHVHSIKVKKDKKNSKSNHMHLTLPRYEAFAQAIQKLVKNNVQIKKIAGQDHIQFKLEADPEKIKKLKTIKLLYNHENHVNRKHTVHVDVATSELNQIVKTLNQQKIKIKLMHDF